MSTSPSISSKSLQIALVGASGRIGTAILDEALARGHRVTAIVSRPERIPTRAGLVVRKGDALRGETLAPLFEGHDVVASAYNPGWTNPNIQAEALLGTQTILDATKRARVPRLLVVGGAGSLEIAPGKVLLDSPAFPAEYVSGATGMRDALLAIRKERDLEWTFVSPAAVLEDGPRTGKFRIGDDTLLTDAKGESRIAVADLAVAIVDELERNAHSQRRFTAAY